jgi:MerR family transcriptional regulator, light-induced transcriptional regulator
MASRDNDIDQRLLEELQREFTDALLRGDEPAAELVLRDAIEADVPEGEIDEVVIAPALRAVGDFWEAGELTVAEEHLATEIALRVIALQREAFRVVRRRPGAIVLLAAVEGEQHVVGLRMAGSLLAHAGYEVKQLGASVPVADLGAMVDRHEPAVVGLSATMPATGTKVAETVAAVRAARPSTAIVVGGAGLPDDVLEQPALRRCRRAPDVVPVVDGLVQRAGLN